MWHGFVMSFWRQFRRKSHQIRWKSNPAIFLAHAMEIPWLELVQSPYNVSALKTGKTWLNDMESSWNLVWIWTKSTPNSMTVPCHLSRFYLLSILEHYTGFGQVQVMEFPWHLLRKWWDFPIRIWSHFWWQTAVKMTWENSFHIFYRVQIDIFDFYPVKNVTWIFSCLCDGSLVKNDIEFDGNPIIFLANAPES